MVDKVLFSSKSSDWATPPELFKFLDERFGFKLDPCPLNPVEDGLKIEWNKTTYINPPYGRDIGKWVEKAFKHSRSGFTQVMLLPARTCTRWWHDFVMKADEIWFIRGRLKFGGSKNTAPFPSVVVVFYGDRRHCLTRLQSLDMKRFKNNCEL